jgi:hypothetical protein
MRTSTLNRCRLLAILGVLVGPAFWLLKKTLDLFHVLRDATSLKTVADYVLDRSLWDGAVVILIGVTFCSAIMLYVIVAPPPRDIDQ